MKTLLSLGVASLFISMTAMTLSGSQDRGGNEGIRGRFVGAWRQCNTRRAATRPPLARM